MRFAEKIIWSCVLTIALIFSIGGTFLIIQNHKHLLDNTIQQNIDQHLTFAYSLESKLLQDAGDQTTEFGNNQTKMDKQALYYLHQFMNTSAQPKSGIALYEPHKQPLYTSIDKQLLKKQTTAAYQLVKQDNQDMMLITSNIRAGSKQYRLCQSYNLTPIYQERNKQYQSFLLIDAMMLLLAFFIIRFITSRLMKPLLTLNTASQHIAQGNYNERTCIAGDDEIGELSKRFDEMSEAIQSTVHRLQQIILSKEEFMGSFSHEIKTPMTAIIGFADMMRSYDCDEETIRKAATFIYEEGNRLEDLSRHLMDLLALSDQKIILEEVSIMKLKDQLQHYFEMMNINNIRFEMEDVYVLGQAPLLFTLVRNLVDNGLKASHDTSVLIAGLIHDRHYEIIVQDYGIGMNEIEIRKATQPFYMADTSRAHSLGGAGLGLSICQKICEAHHTTLHIESLPNYGTAVSVQLEVMRHDT